MSRESHARANIRGGLGVRKRLSEESLRETYRLNGVPAGSAIARCNDKYGRWEYGYTLGVIIRRTASVVQIRWADSSDEVTQYTQGDARYEVDRNRWRIMGRIQGNPLDPENPLAVALTGLLGSGIMGASANNADDDSTDRGDEEMVDKKSNAATEREVAQSAVKNGDLKERDLYTAKQVASRCGTDAKTMRKFFRSSHSTVEPVGQGGRYEFDSKDFPKIKREFDAWTARSQAKAAPKPKNDTVKLADIIDQVSDEFKKGPLPDPWIAGPLNEEPTDEELKALEDLDLDDLDGEDI